MSTYLAADFGGGSGRIMAGTLTEGKLKLEEIDDLEVYVLGKKTK